MIKTQEALKMAVDTHEMILRRIPLHGKDERVVIEKSLEACKEALATNEDSLLVQPAKEPSKLTFEQLNTPFGIYSKPLYTHPAPSWQGLSDDEIDYMWEILGDVKKFARAIEKALKEKNHG